MRHRRTTVSSLRRRIRSARALRHPGPVRVPVRRGLGRSASHLAAVHRRRDREGCDHRTRGAPDPRPVRGEPHDDRCLVRRGARRDRRGRAGGTTPPSSSAPITATFWASVTSGASRRYRRRTARPYPADGRVARRGARIVDALTTTVDLHATIADCSAVGSEHRTHGVSLRPLIEGSTESVRDHVLGGVWGREVHLVTDDGWKYVAPRSGRTRRCRCGRTVGRRCRSRPSRISRCPNRMIGRSWIGCRDRQYRSFASRSWPEIRCRSGPTDRSVGTTASWSVTTPPRRTIAWGPGSRRTCAPRLREALHAIDAPADQLARLGLVPR